MIDLKNESGKIYLVAIFAITMRKIIPLIIISIVAATFFLAVNSSWAKSEEFVLTHLEQAYVVEEINNDGEILNTFKGNSTFSLEREIAIDLGANPYAEDRFISFPRIDMQMGSIIKLYRAPRYTVIDGNLTQIYRSWQGSVGELLSEKDIVLGKEDKINFANDLELEPLMVIKIIRVARTELVEEETIDYKVIEKADPELDRGKMRVEQYGERGIRALTYEVIRENGVEISKTLLRNEVTKEPVSKIEYYGTKPVITVCCNYNDTVLKASQKNGIDPNTVCNLMIKESNGNYNSYNPNGYYGLFQYSQGTWNNLSNKAGYGGYDIYDVTAQIFTTAWALTHGYASRW